MAKLKGLNKLTRELNKYTEEKFGVTCRFGHQFQALPTDKIVYYAIMIGVEMQEIFFNDVHNRFPDIEVTDFTWLLFHEIGHCMTDDMWTQEDEDYFRKQRKLFKKDFFTNEYELANEFYHTMPDEYFATKWASEYIRENPEEIEEFEEMFYEAFTEFLTKNEIEG